MNDKDIEKYLATLEDGWLSNDDLEMSEQEEENVLENHNREQVLDMLQSDEEDTESPQNPESGPPIIESKEINIQVQSMRVN